MLRILALPLAVLLALPSGASVRRSVRLTAAIPARIEITPLLVDFGRIDSGSVTEVPGALTVRVYSSEPWMLMIAPMHSAVTGDVVSVPISRIQYRAGHATTYVPLTGRAELIRGGPTGDAGTLVIVDLRFAPQEEDGAGHFDAEIEFMLLPQAG